MTKEATTNFYIIKLVLFIESLTLKQICFIRLCGCGWTVAWKHLQTTPQVSTNLNSRNA